MNKPTSKYEQILMSIMYKINEYEIAMNRKPRYIYLGLDVLLELKQNLSFPPHPKLHKPMLYGILMMPVVYDDLHIGVGG